MTLDEKKSSLKPGLIIYTAEHCFIIFIWVFYIKGVLKCFW